MPTAMGPFDGRSHRLPNAPPATRRCYQATAPQQARGRSSPSTKAVSARRCCLYSVNLDGVLNHMQCGNFGTRKTLRLIADFANGRKSQWRTHRFPCSRIWPRLIDSRQLFTQYAKKGFSCREKKPLVRWGNFGRSDAAVANRWRYQKTGVSLRLISMRPRLFPWVPPLTLTVHPILHGCSELYHSPSRNRFVTNAADRRGRSYFIFRRVRS